MDTCLAPDPATITGVGGDEMAPLGRPFNVTDTGSENPLLLATKTWTGGLYVPTVNETFAGETERLKSTGETVPELPPPQLTVNSRAIKRIARPGNGGFDLTCVIVPLAHL